MSKVLRTRGSIPPATRSESNSAWLLGPRDRDVVAVLSQTPRFEGRTASRGNGARTRIHQIETTV